MIALLDSNVLLALGLPEHLHHVAARKWMRGQREHGWATCMITESAFVRVSSQYGAGPQRNPQVAIEFLRACGQDPGHCFWKLEEAITAMNGDLQGLLRGSKQVTDFVLVNLALKRGGRMATFDGRLVRALSEHPALKHGVELVPGG